MIAREVNVLLTKAALLDPRMKRVDEATQADMAIAWADVLVDIKLSDALVALEAHYRESWDPIMPADIVGRVGAPVDPWVSVPDVTAEVVAASRARQLEAAGVTEEEFEAHRHDAVWLAAKFPERAAEVSPWAKPREIEQ